jgi:hypothetical protein
METSMPGLNEAKAVVRQTDPREEPVGILIVSDAEGWFVRQVYFIERKLDFNRRLYHSDRSLGGPFESIEDAVTAAKQILYGDQLLGHERIR